MTEKLGCLIAAVKATLLALKVLFPNGAELIRHNMQYNMEINEIKLPREARCLPSKPNAAFERRPIIQLSDYPSQCIVTGCPIQKKQLNEQTKRKYLSHYS